MASLLLGATAAACGSRPPAREQDNVADACAPSDGRAPEPLQKRYDGLAKAARCQPEVYQIMEGVKQALGVECTYCHARDDFAASTHNKAVANWMARELVPRLSEKGGGEVWCNDCHLRADRGVAKILGNPRDRGFAIEWMNTHLVERFETRNGERLLCKNCHGATLGKPDFRAKIVLSQPPPSLPLPP